MNLLEDLLLLGAYPAVDAVEPLQRQSVQGLEVSSVSADAVETVFEWESYEDGMGFEDRGVMDL